MKKLLILFVMAIGMIACNGNSTKSTEIVNDSDSVVVCDSDSIVADSVVIDSIN